VIVSHRYRLIFVKTRKTAGTSIETYLSKRCAPDDVVSIVKPPEPGHEPRNYRGFFNPLPEILASGGRLAVRTLWQLVRRRRFLGMLPAFVVRGRVPRAVWEGYYKFAVDRNPWDKIVSAYWFQTRERGVRMEFDAFLASDRPRGLSDHRMYTDPRSGELLVDRVLRFESLDRELGEVFERCGVPWEGRLSERAKGGYRKDRRPYQELYDDAGRERVERIFAREIELLGYRFEG
jgi:hypothetical protein